MHRVFLGAFERSMAEEGRGGCSATGTGHPTLDVAVGWEPIFFLGLRSARDFQCQRIFPQMVYKEQRCAKQTNVFEILVLMNEISSM